MVTGASYRGNPYSGGTDFDYYTAKYAAADGRLLWEQRYNGPANASDVARSVAVDGGGNVIVTGYSDGGNQYNGSGGTGHDYYTAKYAADDGALLWEQRYNSPGNGTDEAYYGCLAVDASGNVFVSGTSTRYISGPELSFRLRLLHGQVCGGGRRTPVGKAIQRSIRTATPMPLRWHWMAAAMSS